MIIIVIIIIIIIIIIISNFSLNDPCSYDCYFSIRERKALTGLMVDFVYQHPLFVNKK